MQRIDTKVFPLLPSPLPVTWLNVTLTYNDRLQRSAVWLAGDPESVQERSAREHARFCCWLSRSCDASSGLSSFSLMLYLWRSHFDNRCHKSYTEERTRWKSWRETSSKCAVKALYPACWCWFMDIQGYLLFLFLFFRFSFFFFLYLLVLLSSFSFLFSFITVYMIYNMYQVGKTLLVNEVHRPLAKSYGNYISGKFDQFLSASPYSAIIQVNLPFPSHTRVNKYTQALKQLIQQILTESETSLKAWQHRLKEGLKGNGKLMTDLIPDLELVIGMYF